MNRYLNTLLIAIFAIVTYKYNIGLTLFIPLIFFLSKQNEKNIYLIIPLSLLTSYLLVAEVLKMLLIVFFLIIIYLLFFKKRNNLIFDSIFIFALNLLVLLYSTNNSIGYTLFYCLVSVLINMYFVFNIDGVLKKKNKFFNYGYIEIIMAFVVVLGASKVIYFNVNLGLFVALFYVMYFSYNCYFIQSLFFSIINTFILLNVYDLKEAIILPIVSAIYVFRSLYSSILFISFCLLGIIFNIPYLNELTLQISIIIALFFEVFKPTIASIKNEKKDLISDVYTEVIENINNEIIGFASFLDLFARDFSDSKEYTEKISIGITNLTNSYCNGCYMRNSCFSKNKGKLYSYFKNLILYSKRSETDIGSADMASFMKKCIYGVEMRKSAIIIYDKLALTNTHSRMQTLIAQVNGVSSILRQYVTDTTSRNLYCYNVFLDIKKALNDYGFNVCFFNIKKMFVNDFFIEVGIRGIDFVSTAAIIEKICNNYIVNKTSLCFNKVDKNKVYFNILPKINYIVDYGHGAIASGDNLSNGDNYLIKSEINNKIIVAIADGMGKGYVANQESKNTLKLVDEITNLDLSTQACLQILNTFYFIQDYLEKYSTLDFLEIDKTKGEAMFYKMGATTSYIFSKCGNIVKIENENLPFGIEEIIEKKIVKIEDGDLVVMASDGIFENIIETEELEQYIFSKRTMSSQNIAYEILNYSKNKAKITEDDMSVVVLKIEKAS